MIILYLILAHLIADFVLQPAKLIEWKMRSNTGIIIHSLIHAAISALLVFPYLSLKTAFIILALAITHYLIDYAKINISLKSDKYVEYFVVDQICHFIAIIGAGFSIMYFNNWQEQNLFISSLYNNPHLPLFLILFVFMTYTIEIYRHIKKHGVSGAKFNYRDMLMRMTALTFVYILFTGIGYLISIL